MTYRSLMEALKLKSPRELDCEVAVLDCWNGNVSEEVALEVAVKDYHGEEGDVRARKGDPILVIPG